MTTSGFTRSWRDDAGMPIDESHDPILHPLLTAAPAAQQQLIETLILKVARPLANVIVSRYRRTKYGLAAQDAADVLATVQLRLVARLQDVAAGRGTVIRDFENYVAVLTFNAVNDHFRKTYPARAVVKGRLRHALRRDGRLGLWMAGGVAAGGLVEWVGRFPWGRGTELPLLGDRENPADALVEFFVQLGAPLRFEDLIAHALESWTAGPAAEPESGGAEILPGLVMKEYLAALWSEIRELPPMQRKALLLNLRSPDSANVAALLVLSGATPFDDLAAALEMSAEELGEIWHDLPYDDQRIAALLGVRRQQVINLRQSARQRLGRRMRGERR
jgi:hypothetical protein